MLNKLKLKIPAIKLAGIKKIPWILGISAFWIILFFVFIGSSFGLFLFYKYAVLIEGEEIPAGGNSVKFKSNIYKKVMEEWRLKEQKFGELKTEEYSNPFIAKTPDETGTKPKNQKQTNNKVDPETENPVIK